jgi:hypothetical protein
VSAAGEQPRFLHRYVGRNYTESAFLAVPGEPECLTAAEQRAQTARAHRRWQQEQQRAWGRAATSIGQALSTFVRDGHPDRRLLDDVKAIERPVGRVDRHLGLS